MQEEKSRKIGKNPSENPTSYQIDNRTFIVESVFQPDGKETLGDVLFRLIKSDIVKA